MICTGGGVTRSSWALWFYWALAYYKLNQQDPDYFCILASTSVQQLNSMEEQHGKSNVTAGSRPWTRLMQIVHSVLGPVTLNEVVGRRPLTLKAWLTAESSMGQSILPFTLTVPTKRSCCLTSWQYKAQQIGDTEFLRSCLLVWRRKDDNNNILTSLKTCKSATQTTTLTRWSSLCEERLRESREWTSVD